MTCVNNAQSDQTCGISSLVYLDLCQAGTLERIGQFDLTPSKIIGIGRNYRAHAAELQNPIPLEPLMFLKASSALLGPSGEIVRPRGFERVDYEGELAVVIGQSGRRISESSALDHVLGYTCLNDVTVRDLQQKDKLWTRAKGMDSFCPIGPRIVCGLDVANLRIVTRVNGEIRQDGRTADMIFPIDKLIAYASQYLTLAAGDVIATGTPEGVGNLQPGDVVTVEIEGIGVLENRVVDDVE